MVKKKMSRLAQNALKQQKRPSNILTFMVSFLCIYSYYFITDFLNIILTIPDKNFGILKQNIFILFSSYNNMPKFVMWCHLRFEIATNLSSLL